MFNPTLRFISRRKPTELHFIEFFLMERDWFKVARMALPPPGIHAATTPVTAMAFDTSQELFWAGNEYVSFLLFQSLNIMLSISRAEFLHSMARSSSATRRSRRTRLVMAQSFSSCFMTRVSLPWDLRESIWQRGLGRLFGISRMFVSTMKSSAEC